MVCVCMLSSVQFFATLWIVACQPPLSMKLSRQEYWSGLPFPPPGDRPNPGIKPTSFASPAMAGGFFTTEPPGKSDLQSRNRDTDVESKCVDAKGEKSRTFKNCDSLYWTPVTYTIVHKLYFN